MIATYLTFARGQAFFEYACNSSSVITGYNDELLFHVSESFAMSHGISPGMPC